MVSRQREWQKRQRAAGRCARCGCEPMEGKTQCSRHRAYANRMSRLYYWRVARVKIAAKNVQGLCGKVHCDNPLGSTAQFCDQHRSEFRSYQRERYHRLRHVVKNRHLPRVPHMMVDAGADAQPAGATAPSAARCQNCGNYYLALYSVPDSVWVRISPRHPHGGLLCLNCCDNLARDIELPIIWEGKLADHREAIETIAPAMSWKSITVDFKEARRMTLQQAARDLREWAEDHRTVAREVILDCSERLEAQAKEDS